jgi:hypothetical protein
MERDIYTLRAVTASLVRRAESSLDPALASAVLVAGITLVGLVLRAPGLDETVIGDELFTHELATRPGLGDAVSGVASDLEISPPLYFVAAWAAAKLGDPNLWVRVPSFVAGVATIPAVYALGLRTVGRSAALAGAALLALSPFAVFYSAEARPYALTVLFVVLSTLALLSALDSGGRLHWGLFALATLAALLSHYTAVFALAGQAGWAAWARRDRLRELAIAHGVVAIGLTPWLPSFLEDRTAGFQTAIETFWPFTTSFFFRSLGGFVVGNPYVGLRSIPGLAALALIGAGLLFGLAAGGRAAAAALRRREVVLIAVLALATPVLAALYSLPFASVFVPRTLLSSLPAVCLAAGLLLTSAPRRLVAPAMALVLAGFAIGAARVIVWSPKPPFREAAGHIDARTGPGDPVLDLVLDFGSLETELTPPFQVWRETCTAPAREPGQIVTAALPCGVARVGFERALRGRPRALVLANWTDPPPTVPELERGWRLVDSRTFENHFIPLMVLEYARR